jgi:hypothetical protein
MDDLVDAWRQEGRTLDICLPAGNSFGARAHAPFELAAGGSVNWVVPPDGDAPAFLEVWWPEPVRPEQARLYVTPAGGVRRRVQARAVLHSSNAWFSHIKRVGRCTMALLVVHPTSGRSGLPVGRHGVWRIEVPALNMQQTPAEQGGTDRSVHVYVARADHNLGARRRARASHLEDEDAGRGRFLAPAQRFEEVPGSAIRRQGTLSGIATGKSTRVAGGHQWKDGDSADYSSSGPTRGMRVSPDHSCVTDRSAVLKGLLANGVRTGTKVRIVGTSAAAPQLGRHLLQQKPPPNVRSPVGEAQPTTPQTAPGPDLRQGDGRLSPAPGRFRRR